VDLVVEKDSSEAFHLAEQAKARALSSLITARRKNKSLGSTSQDEAIRSASQSIARLRTQLMSRKVLPRERAEIEKQIEELEFDLKEAEAKADIDGYKDRLVWFQPASVNQVQEKLSRKKDCLVEFLLGEHRSFEWLISSDQMFLEILPGRKEIETEVNQYLGIIASRPNNLYLERQLAEQMSRGEKLFTFLFGQLAERLPSDGRLVIVPDGILHHLPFEALVHNRQYLIGRTEISYLPSASLLGLLLDSTSRAASGDKMDFLGFGDPVFNPDPKAKSADSDIDSPGDVLRAYNDFQLAPLPGTRGEIEEIASLFKPSRSRIYLGKQSTEDAVKSELLRQYRRLHFATHSLVDERDPSRSAIVFTLDDDPREDGFLYMSDIAEMELDCDLIVLSSCQTGRGQLLSGEGILGFSRAFLYAGARSVVVSLWNVSDISTGRMMKGFYQHLVRGEGNAAALREAKLQMIRGGKETQHPYYWAAFILVGKP